ncbi:hypothetical protein D3C72_1933130 [compost metagenome]
MQQLADRLERFVSTLQGWGLDAVEQGFVKQQLQLGLLRQLAQRRRQRLRRQVQLQRRGLGLQAQGQARGQQ